MKDFPDNAETGFIVATKRHTGNGVPKLPKASGGIEINIEDAFASCDRLNKSLDPSGNTKCFGVFEVEQP